MNMATKKLSLPLASFLCLGVIMAMYAQSPNPRKPPLPNVPNKTLSISKSELIEAGKLSAIYFKAVAIAMDSTYEIKSYKVSIFAKGRNPDLDMSSYTDSIPARILERIKTYEPGAKVFFEYVKAGKRNISRSMDSLPPLSIVLTD